MEELSETLETKVNRQLKDADRLGKIFGNTAKEIAEDKISILQSAIENLVEAGDPGGVGSILQGFIDQLRALGKSIEETPSRVGIAADNIRRIRLRVFGEQADRLKGLQDDFNAYIAERDEEQTIEKKEELDKQLADAKEHEQNIRDEKLRTYQFTSDLISGMADFTSGILARMGEENKAAALAAAMINKAAAIFQAIINTAVAVTNAMANIPVPFNLAAAKMIKIAGGLQIAAIMAAPMPGFARGADFVVPPGYPNDSYLMAAESGEHVSITPKEKTGREVVVDVHDCTFVGPGGMREFTKQIRFELASLEVLNQ